MSKVIDNILATYDSKLNNTTDSDPIGLKSKVQEVAKHPATVAGESTGRVSEETATGADIHRGQNDEKPKAGKKKEKDSDKVPTIKDKPDSVKSTKNIKDSKDDTEKVVTTKEKSESKDSYVSDSKANDTKDKDKKAEDVSQSKDAEDTKDTKVESNEPKKAKKSTEMSDIDKLGLLIQKGNEATLNAIEKNNSTTLELAKSVISLAKSFTKESDKVSSTETSDKNSDNTSEKTKDKTKGKPKDSKSEHDKGETTPDVNKSLDNEVYDPDKAAEQTAKAEDSASVESITKSTGTNANGSVAENISSNMEAINNEINKSVEKPKDEHKDKVPVNETLEKSSVLAIQYSNAFKERYREDIRKSTLDLMDKERLQYLDNRVNSYAASPDEADEYINYAAKGIK